MISENWHHLLHFYHNKLRRTLSLTIPCSNSLSHSFNEFRWNNLLISCIIPHLHQSLAKRFWPHTSSQIQKNMSNNRLQDGHRYRLFQDALQTSKVLGITVLNLNCFHLITPLTLSKDSDSIISNIYLQKVFFVTVNIITMSREI